MKISYLKAFLTLSKIKNYSAAAEELFISQPSLSRHIKSLEWILGTELFKRSTRKIELNEYGRLLLPYSEKITALYDELISEISRQHKDANDTVIIGTVPTMILYDVTSLLELYSLRFPSSAVHIIEESTNELLHLLRDGRCDFAFIRRFISDAGELDGCFRAIPLTGDVMVVLIPSEHPLAGQENLSITQLKGEKLILPKGSTLYSKITASFEQAGIHPNVSFVASRSDDAVDMARKGIGIAFTLKSAMKGFSADGITVRELDTDYSMCVDFVYMKSKKMNPASLSFLGMAEKWIAGH